MGKVRSGLLYTTPFSNLAIDKRAREKVKVDKKFDYTLKVPNNDSSAAEGVTVTDPLPEGVQFIVRRTDSRCSYEIGTRTVRCALATLAAGGSDQVVIQVKATTTGKQTNTATVTDSIGTNPQSDTAVTKVKK